jgi:hypothetical protein
VKPKSHKIFKKGIAEEVGVHQNVVDDFIDFYYSKIRKNLSDLTAPSITVAGLGIFQIRKGKLKKAIKKNKDIIGNLEKRTYDGIEKHMVIVDKLKAMEAAMGMIEEIEKKKKEFIKNKNENKTGTKSNP